MRPRIALALTLAFAVLAPGANAAPRAPLTLEDFRTTVGISDLHFSPGGRQLAFVTRTADFANDKRISIVRVLDLETGSMTTVTRPSDAADTPRWSPDGSQLAFLARPKKADAAASASEPSPAPTGTAGASDDKAYDARQIAVVSRASMAAVFVTHEPRGVDAFAWQPDGRSFTFLEQDEAPNQKAIDAHDDAFEVGDNQWNLTAAPIPTHLWTISARGGTARRITHGGFSLSGEPQPTRDGRAVLLLRYPDAYDQHYASRRLVRVGLRDGAVETVVKNAPAEGRFSRDGTRFAYLSQNPHAFSIDDAFVGPANGSAPVDVTERLDRTVNDAAFDADDRSLVVAVSDATHLRLFRVNRAGSKALDIGDRNVSAFDVDRNGRIAFVASSPHNASEIFVLANRAAPHGGLRQLTRFNIGLARHQIAHVQRIEWQTKDGVRADGVVTSPLSGTAGAAGARAPLVLVIHGGPTSSSIETFSEIPQLLAAHGFYVFEPNYRGSNNLGAAFAQGTVPHITSVPGDDIESGVDAVLKAYPIDPARIGVSGWSEGGLLTSWLITHDTRWKAAMSGAAVNDWLMYRDLTDAQDFTSLFMSPISPWTDVHVRDLYRAESPLTFAAQVKTPTLIMTDAGDQRVPTPLAYAFFHAVRATGTPVTMVVEPADGHFPSDPVRSEDVVRRWVDWFATKL
jgi:dipeptidyl aminopeptidase/acylaminoacyl peptidase